MCSLLKIDTHSVFKMRHSQFEYEIKGSYSVVTDKLFD